MSRGEPREALDKGEGSDRKVFGVAYDGPRTWIAYGW
jgi:hypothetical protein